MWHVYVRVHVRTCTWKNQVSSAKRKEVQQLYWAFGPQHNLSLALLGLSSPYTVPVHVVCMYMYTYVRMYVHFSIRIYTCVVVFHIRGSNLPFCGWCGMWTSHSTRPRDSTDSGLQDTHRHLGSHFPTMSKQILVYTCTISTYMYIHRTT